MDQRPPTCAHRAPRLPVPCTTTSTPAMSAALHTTPWPHHPDAVYRPLPPGTAGMSRSDPGQTSSAGYSPSPYPTFSQLGITSPGHIDRWWARECHDPSRFPLYYPYPLTPPMPVNPDSETQDDRFPLSQRGECLCRLCGRDRCQHRQGARARHLGRARCLFMDRSSCLFLGRVRTQMWGRGRCPMRGTM
jgi:hypothetical protein